MESAIAIRCEGIYGAAKAAPYPYPRAPIIDYKGIAAVKGEQGTFLGDNMVNTASEERFLDLSGWKDGAGMDETKVDATSKNTYSNRSGVATRYDTGDLGGQQILVSRGVVRQSSATAAVIDGASPKPRQSAGHPERRGTAQLLLLFPSARGGARRQLHQCRGQGVRRLCRRLGVHGAAARKRRSGRAVQAVIYRDERTRFDLGLSATWPGSGQ